MADQWNVARGPLLVELPPSRRRRLTLAAALKQASKVGRTVSGAVLDPSGAIELKFGEQKAGNGAVTDVDRELAEFEARHEA